MAVMRHELVPGNAERNLRLLSAAVVSLVVSVMLSGSDANATRDRSDGAIFSVNVIDGVDDRDLLLAIGPALGLSAAEIERIRKVSGYVGCFLPTPSVGSGALFLTNRQVISAAHIFFTPSGQRRSGCFFKSQAEDAQKIDIVTDHGRAAFGAIPPKPGSNADFAIVTLAEPVPGAMPFPVEDGVPVAVGDRLIVISAHPVGMEKTVDNSVPVAQGCTVKRVPVSTAPTSFYRTDCDATGSSSGGMQLSRVGGRLVFRGITISAGPWQDPKYYGAPYNEQAGSVTTALGTNAAVLAAGRYLAKTVP